jgi:hypothetical protein
MNVAHHLTPDKNAVGVYVTFFDAARWTDQFDLGQTAIKTVANRCAIGVAEAGRDDHFSFAIDKTMLLRLGVANISQTVLKLAKVFIGGVAKLRFDDEVSSFVNVSPQIFFSYRSQPLREGMDGAEARGDHKIAFPIHETDTVLTLFRRESDLRKAKRSSPRLP